MRVIGAVLLCCLFAQLSWPAEAPRRLTEFDIRAQPLAGALLQFSSQSGIQVLAADTRVAELSVRSVRGRMTAAAALGRLLGGTGLTFQQVDAGTIALGRIETAVVANQRAPAEAPGNSEAPGNAPEASALVLPELAEAQVTGTRILVPGNYTAPNPMTTISAEELRQQGIVNLADAMTTLVPQNNSIFQPALAGDDLDGSIARGSFFIGNTITNLRGLDPMFGTRTLTMIDGRRVVSTSNQADVVDMNIIPSNLLQRVDVVTGGASATYGSGAMAGVVNLVLNRRMTGVNLDLDYGLNEAGDGGSPHVAAAAGMPLFGGRGHALLGVEWQKQSAIRDCAAARKWCEKSRDLYQNFSGAAQEVGAALVPLEGFGDVDGDGVADYPARFEVSNLRYSQFAPTGTVYSSSAANTSGYRFTADGTGIEEYAYGFRGGTGRDTMNGDGPLVSAGQTMRPGTSRGTAFANLEYDFNERTTGYLQGSYARTKSLNSNRDISGTACVRFNTMGVAAQSAGSARRGDFIAYGGNGEAFRDPVTKAPYVDLAPERSPLWRNANFRLTLGNAPSGRTPPYFVPPGSNGSTNTEPPVWTFTNGVDPQWQRITSANGTAYWNLVGVTLNVDFDDPGTPAVLPALGRDAYAFLNQLTPEALYQVQRAFGNSATAGGGPGVDTLFGTTPCNGFTAVRKVWNPQVQQWTSLESETMRAVAGARGRYGNDWRWEAYYQFGETNSTSRQNNVQTNLSFAFAMDAIIDDRVGSATYGQPICRIERDGVPVVDAVGRPTSDPVGLAALAEGCKPLNIFGTTFADPVAAQLQQEALDYAFKQNISDGENSLHVLSFTTSGTLWQGIGAGPLTSAFGAEFRQDMVDNAGSRGPFYERADIARTWGDAFGGKTRVAEGYTELNLPLISNLPGINLWSVNAGLRYASYHNEGGAGTTGEAATQSTMNWKFSTVFEPFDWVRLRMTRSHDLRAAGYRDLFLNQPGVPDNTSGSNPWRERAAESTENQRERWGTITVGNSQLRPERSDTLTLGLVMLPGDWARGMRLSVDYYDIKVRDGIYTSFNSADPRLGCWEQSGNVEAMYVDGEVDPDHPGINGLFNPDLAACREITFAANEDGSRNLQDIVSINSNRPENGLLYQRRGLDLAWNYMFQLNQLFNQLPGSVSLTLRATRTLEASGLQRVCTAFAFNAECTAERFDPVDLAGQIRSNTFIAGVSASPDWTGNIISSYRLGDLTAGLSARYIGGARLDNTWTDDPDSAGYLVPEDGQLVPSYGTVDNNFVKPYFNFALNASYDLQVANTTQFQVFGSINNLFDKSPPFTGGGLSGATAQFHDTMGRAYRVGVRMKF